MARKRSPGAATVPLFRPDQTDLFEESYEERLDRAETPVECLGRTFPSEAARRAHYLGRLREFLADPAFREREGFPVGRDEDILRLSDPPWYTACPNPFLAEILAHYGRAFDPAV